MSARFPHPSRRERRGTAALAGLVAVSLAATGCTASSGGEGSGERGQKSSSQSSSPPVSEASVTTNVRDRAANVRVDKVVELETVDGTFDKVSVTVGAGSKQLRGNLSDDKTKWASTQRLEPGLRYQVRTVAVDSEGLAAKDSSAFSTKDLTLDQQTFPSLAPLDGETVGVGMPVIVQFDVPVTDRANIEKHLSVETSPRQAGSWSWLSDNEVHWRPKSYWKSGTDVTVNADINSVSAGKGVFGQHSRSASFTVGDALVSKIDVVNYEMKVFRNGSLLRTIPVTAGKDGFVTRSGTKVIMEKERYKTMDAATIGISKDDPEYYAIDVEYAMRVTYSGEFVHGAPWSEGSQGSDNVSHGCVGMSMTDAAWLFDLSKRGDVVEVTGTDRTMEPGNGYTDWNKSFAEYAEGSAL
ncbi:MAG TPA: Ig-like domain-containing protein [Nocardioidaceae bacterium]|nr:Ig-like domain-containing protein [Nocardioidaceae bacterium]